MSVLVQLSSTSARMARLTLDRPSLSLSLSRKKSWHPLLITNQERVWKVEKVKAEEAKKTKQLMKERDEERQLAELQRMQEEQTGKKKVDKLDWMYAAPASGGGIKGDELEDYLLGKRRVDKILQGDEEKAVRNKTTRLDPSPHLAPIADTTPA